MKNQKLKTRIEQYRVDIAYTKEAYYSAFFRLSKEQKQKMLIRRWLSFSTIIFGVVTLSGLINMVFGIEESRLTIVATVFSALSLLISIYLTGLERIDDPHPYLQRADSFTVFYKWIKTKEASLDEANTAEIEGIIKALERKYQIVGTNPLPLEFEDYKKALENIKNGNLTYVEEDFQNT